MNKLREMAIIALEKCGYYFPTEKQISCYILFGTIND